MKGSKKQCLMYALVLLILVFFGGFQAQASQLEPEKLYYGIEINGVLCGYSEISLSPMVKDGKDMTLLKQKVFAMLSALGSKFNTEVKLTYHIDPVTGKFTYHDSDIKQGPTQLGSVTYIEGDTARFTSTPGDRETTIALPPDVVLENTLSFPHLIRDFVEGKMNKASYEIYEVRETEVQKSTYTKVGTEKLELAGKSYNALVLDKLNHKTGLKATMWLDEFNKNTIFFELDNQGNVESMKIDSVDKFQR